MADHPLRSATDRRLGGQLSHQLANQTRVHPIPVSYTHLDVYKRQGCREHTLAPNLDESKKISDDKDPLQWAIILF